MLVAICLEVRHKAHKSMSLMKILTQIKSKLLNVLLVCDVFISADSFNLNFSTDELHIYIFFQF